MKLLKFISTSTLSIYGYMFFAFVYAPIVLIVVFSFNSNPVNMMIWDSFTFDWYKTIFGMKTATTESAQSGPVSEGNVGGGAGMICYEYKGGTGTASRKIIIDEQDFTLGVLVQANHGIRPWLIVLGVPVGQEMLDAAYLNLNQNVARLFASSQPTCLLHLVSWKELPDERQSALVNLVRLEGIILAIYS